MKMKDLIAKHFNFLLDNGFQEDREVYYKLLYISTFTDKDDWKIVISVNVRDDYVDMKIKRPTKVLLNIEYGKVIKRHEFNGLEDLLLATENIYAEVRNARRRFSKKYIVAILTLYANFIKDNFTNITGRTIV
ncbi:MAG: hypothetical protein GX241_05370 [Ruminococcaceae bacterium]|nr:hypothetical protein [Oscillospiraceae bacterium]